MALLLLAAPLGVFLATVRPLGQVADEPQQLMRADGLLHHGLIGYRAPVRLPNGTTALQSGVTIDPALEAVVTSPFAPAPPATDAAREHSAHEQRWTGHEIFYAIGAIAGYFPIFYLPQAAALTVARAFDVSPYYAFYAARLTVLAVWLALGLAAMALAQRARGLLLATLLLPMTLDLASSTNQDGLLIAAAVLGAAAMTGQGSGRRAIAALAIGSVILAKPPYLPLAAILLLDLPRRRPLPAEWRTLAGRVTLAALIAALATGWTAFAVIHTATPVIRSPAEAGPLWPGPRPAIFSGTDLAAQMRVLLTHPSLVVTLPYATLSNDPALWRQAIGRLGWLNLGLPSGLYRLWTACLAAAALGDALDGETAPTWPETLLLVTAAILTLDAVYLSQYLSWTPVGSDVIGGVQGRYLLPILPIIALAIPRLARGRLGAVLAAAPVLAGAATLATLPKLLVDFYYLR